MLTLGMIDGRELGAAVGAAVTVGADDTLGREDGPTEILGCIVGLSDGIDDGGSLPATGASSRVGDELGTVDGSGEGALDGDELGVSVGAAVIVGSDDIEGAVVGKLEVDGAAVGDSEGFRDGKFEGLLEGHADGTTEGCELGALVCVVGRFVLGAGVG